MRPDFLIIGAPRSGTTSLYEYLSAHPSVYMAQPKEIHFFTFGQTYNNMTISDYEAHFHSATPDMVCGEASHSYIWYPGTAEKIKSYNRLIKLIVLLRNPVDRALSDYYYAADRSGAALCDVNTFFSGGLRALTEGRLTLHPFAPSSVLWKGCYGSHVEDYLSSFPESSLLFIPFRTLVEKPDEATRAVCDFLSVPYDPNLRLPHTNASRPQRRDGEEAVRELLAEMYCPQMDKLEHLTGVRILIQ